MLLPYKDGGRGGGGGRREVLYDGGTVLFWSCGIGKKVVGRWVFKTPLHSFVRRYIARPRTVREINFKLVLLLFPTLFCYYFTS